MDEINFEELQKNIQQAQDKAPYDPNASVKFPEGYTPVKDIIYTNPTEEVSPITVGEVEVTSDIDYSLDTPELFSSYSEDIIFGDISTEEAYRAFGIEFPTVDVPNVFLGPLFDNDNIVSDDIDNSNNSINEDLEVVDPPEPPVDPPVDPPEPPVDPPVDPPEPPVDPPVDPPEPPVDPPVDPPEPPVDPPVDPPEPPVDPPEPPVDPPEPPVDPPVDPPEPPEPPVDPPVDPPEPPVDPPVDPPEPPVDPPVDPPEPPEPPVDPPVDPPEPPVDPPEPPVDPPVDPPEPPVDPPVDPPEPPVDPPEPPVDPPVDPPEPPEQTGQNPGNNKPVGNSPFDGITGNSSNNGDKTPNAGPMEGGEDDIGEQPGWKGNGPSNANKVGDMISEFLDNNSMEEDDYPSYEWQYEENEHSDYMDEIPIELMEDYDFSNFDFDIPDQFDFDYPE